MAIVDEQPANIQLAIVFRQQVEENNAPVYDVKNFFTIPGVQDLWAVQDSHLATWRSYMIGTPARGRGLGAIHYVHQGVSHFHTPKTSPDRCGHVQVVYPWLEDDGANCIYDHPASAFIVPTTVALACGRCHFSLWDTHSKTGVEAIT